MIRNLISSYLVDLAFEFVGRIFKIGHEEGTPYGNDWLRCLLAIMVDLLVLALIVAAGYGIYRWFAGPA